MENASKALLMAAGVLIALIIIGALLLMFNNLSNYQETNTQNTRESQIVEFNKQFETYNRKDVRGNELMSLANKVIDYNERKTGDTSDEKYEKMEILVEKINKNDFLYKSNDTSYILISYNQDSLKQLLTYIQQAEDMYGRDYISKLNSNISNIVDSSDPEGEKKVQEILPKDLNQYPGGFKMLKTKILPRYYQYAQFKKAYFNCTDRKYNSNTGRIVSMTFEFVKIGD